PPPLYPLLPTRRSSDLTVTSDSATARRAFQAFTSESAWSSAASLTSLSSRKASARWYARSASASRTRVSSTLLRARFNWLSDNRSEEHTSELQSRENLV